MFSNSLSNSGSSNSEELGVMVIKGGDCGNMVVVDGCGRVVERMHGGGCGGVVGMIVVV